MSETDHRYPYTYAADYMRTATDHAAGCTVSRCDAALMRGAIAKAIGMDDAALARLLADQYLKDIAS